MAAGQQLSDHSGPYKPPALSRIRGAHHSPLVSLWEPRGSLHQRAAWIARAAASEPMGTLPNGLWEVSQGLVNVRFGALCGLRSEVAIR